MMTQSSFDSNNSNQELPAQMKQLELIRSDLERAKHLRRTGNVPDAIRILNKILQGEPHYFAAWTILGQLYMENSDYSAAFNSYIQAFLLNPNHGSTLFKLSEICRRIGRNDAAIEWLQKGLQLEPDNYDALLSLGEILLKLYRYKEAAELLWKAHRIAPDNSSPIAAWAKCMSHIGQRDQALDAYHEAYRLAKAEKNASLMSILYEMLDFELREIKLDIKRELEEYRQQINLKDLKDIYHFNVAKYKNKTKEYKETWDSLERANSLIFSARKELIIRDRSIMRFLKSQAKEINCSDFNNPRPNDNAAFPIFLIGASRAGKTTLENVIQSLGPAQRGFERDLLRDAVVRANQLFGLPNSAGLESLPDDADPMIKRCFLSELEQLSTGSRFITTTDPGSIRYVGRYARIIDNAVFIFLTRNKDDQAFRIFGKKYTFGNSLSYSIPTIYELLDWYSEMITIWSKKLNKRSLVLNYEELVSDPDNTIKKIKKFIPEMEFSNNFDLNHNDCGCAEPYISWMHSAKEAGNISVQEIPGISNKSFSTSLSYKL